MSYPNSGFEPIAKDIETIATVNISAENTNECNCERTKPSIGLNDVDIFDCISAFLQLADK